MLKWEPLCFSDLIFPKCSGPKSYCHFLFEVATPQAEPCFLVNRCGANTDSFMNVPGVGAMGVFHPSQL